MSSASSNDKKRGLSDSSGSRRRQKTNPKSTRHLVANENSNRRVIISVWIPKGGVGKSTTTFSLGYALAHRGYRVLLVDGDSQRDLSNLCLKKKFDVDEFDHSYTNYIERGGKRRTWSYMLEGIERAPTYNLNFDVETETVLGEPDLENGGFLALLAGDRNMDKWDSVMGIAENELLHHRDSRRKPGAPYHALQHVADQVDADIVLVDLNPGRGTFNRLVLMSSDYFLVPTKADYFSFEAVSNMMVQIARDKPAGSLDVLPQEQSWRTYVRSHIHKYTNMEGNSNPFPAKTPKFLGFVISDYPIRNGNGERRIGGVCMEICARNIERWMNCIHGEVRARVDQELLFDGRALAFHDYVYRDLNIFPYLLCKVRTFGHLQALSHHYGVPVPFLKHRHCKVDDGNGNMRLMKSGSVNDVKSTVMLFRRTYDQLAWNILSLIAHDELPVGVEARILQPRNNAPFGHRPTEEVALNVPPTVGGVVVDEDAQSEDWSFGSDGETF